MKKITLLAVAVLLTIGACTKYPEGPSFTLKSAEKRLVGKWKAKTFFIDGEDQFETTWYGSNTKLPCSTFTDPKYCTDYNSALTLVTYDFKKGGTLTETWTNTFNSLDYTGSDAACNCLYTKRKDETDTYGETWNFNKDKSLLTIEYNGKRTEFEILKLTSKELSIHAKATTNSKETKVTLEKE